MKQRAMGAWCISVALAALLLAAANVVEARPIGSRRLAQKPTSYTIEWDAAYVPYPHLMVFCGDMLTFRWQGTTPQSVAEMKAGSLATVQERCTTAKPLTEATTSGEQTVKLLEPGTFYFVEPAACQQGQVLAVTVACEGGAGTAQEDGVEAAATVDAQPEQPAPVSALAALAPAPAK